MKWIRYVIAAALLALFALAAANWSVFSNPTPLSLLFVEFEAPLGLLLLGATLGIALLFFAYSASLRTAMLLESRRLTRELEEQRQLADQAEASRFTELRAVLEQSAADLAERVQGAGAAQAERAEALEQGLRSALEVAANSLAAHIGQVDDKLDRALAREPS